MSPQHTIPDTQPTRASSQRTRQHEQPRPFFSAPATAQTTMWNFIQPHLPRPPRPTQALDSTPTTIPQPHPPVNPNTQPRNQTQPQTQQQNPTIGRPLNDNLPWGDTHHLAYPHEYFWVLSKNVGTLNTASLDMTAIATKLNKLDASIFLAQETNTKWTLSTLQQITTQCHKVYTHKKIATYDAGSQQMGQSSNPSRTQNPWPMVIP